MSKKTQNNDENTIPIKLPDYLSDWFDKKVITTPGLHNSIFVITPERWEIASQNLTKSIEEYGSNESFTKHMFGGVVLTRIDKDGFIFIADFIMHRFGHKSDLDFKIDNGMFYIYRPKSEDCICKTSSCLMCLRFYCTDPDCKVHTPERKADRKIKNII